MSDTPKSRSEAKAIGAVKYVTGKPCPKGHVGPRYTSNGECVECSISRSASKVKSGYFNKRYHEKSDEILARARERYANDPGARKKNAEAAKLWAANNKDRVGHIKRSYKARRRAVKSTGISGGELAAWVTAQVKICHWCGKGCHDDYHVDHYHPLSKGGEHETENLVISCPSCNLIKNAKDPYEFANSIGRLF